MRHCENACLTFLFGPETPDLLLSGMLIVELAILQNCRQCVVSGQIRIPAAACRENGHSYQKLAGLLSIEKCCIRNQFGFAATCISIAPVAYPKDHYPDYADRFV